jgi:hypothetical protein
MSACVRERDENPIAPTTWTHFIVLHTSLQVRTETEAQGKKETAEKSEQLHQLEDQVIGSSPCSPCVRTPAKKEWDIEHVIEHLLQ